MMSTSVTLEDLRLAIDQLGPELPGLVGDDYTVFIEKLNTFLQKEDITLLLDLFSDYPAAHDRLLDILDKDSEDEGTKNSRLFGNTTIVLPNLYYRCESEPKAHIVELRDIERRNPAGSALCPRHHVEMRPVSLRELQAAIKRLRPELQNLVGVDYQAFIVTLESFLRYGNDEQLAKLFSSHPAAHQRLLEILVE